MQLKRRFVQAPASVPYLLPPSVDDWVPENHLARHIKEVVAKLDLSEFYLCYEELEGRGRPPFDPAMMLRTLIYCYATGRFSSRKIETATYDDIAVRFLTEELHPDHDSFADFRKRHLSRFASVFVQVVHLSVEMGFTKLGHLALDGTKLKGAASKRNTFTVEKLAEALSKERALVRELLAKAAEVDAKDEADDKLVPAELAKHEERLARLERAKALYDEQMRALTGPAEAQQAEAADASATPPQACPGPARLKKARLARGLTQRQLAEVTGLTRNRIDALERDRCIPSEDEIRRLSEVLGVDASALLFRAKVKKPKPPKPTPPAGPKHVNIVDPDSNIMVTREGAARIQGYNPQIVVDQHAGIIVAGFVSNCTTDTVSHGPAVGLVVNNLGRLPPIWSADSGYFSAVNVTDPRLEGVEVLVPPKRDPKHCKQPNSIVTAMREKLADPSKREIYNMRSAIVEPAFSRIKCAQGFTRFRLRGLAGVTGEWHLVTTAQNLMRMFAMMNRNAALAN